MDPDLEDWKRKVSVVPDEELIELHDDDYLGFTRVPHMSFSAFADIVEDEIQRRGLPCKAN